MHGGPRTVADRASSLTRQTPPLHGRVWQWVRADRFLRGPAASRRRAHDVPRKAEVSRQRRLPDNRWALCLRRTRAFSSAQVFSKVYSATGDTSEDLALSCLEGAAPEYPVGREGSAGTPAPSVFPQLNSSRSLCRIRFTRSVRVALYTDQDHRAGSGAGQGGPGDRPLPEYSGRIELSPWRGLVLGTPARGRSGTLPGVVGEMCSIGWLAG